ncbi:MAG TPA: dephospho-CoA kinase [Egibacteraceae bacterium]|nr:dephospho-CoA kinase [Egibacteraceae bacterium]
MFLVGLTGGVASGKSTVAARLVKHGAELIDADEIAREVVLPGTPTWKKIVDHFGSEVLADDGFIDRPALGAIVFADGAKRALLNELTHPPVMEVIADRLEVLAPFDGIVVLDVPLLVETGADLGCEALIVVAATPETQLQRLVGLRGASEQEARDRIASQAPLEDKLAVATHLIWNEGSLDEVLAETDRVAEDLLGRAREKAESQARELPDN